VAPGVTGLIVGATNSFTNAFIAAGGPSASDCPFPETETPAQRGGTYP